jgi:hypothetical protein
MTAQFLPGRELSATCRQVITDHRLRALPLIGSVDQVSDGTDVLAAIGERGAYGCPTSADHRLRTDDRRIRGSASPDVDHRATRCRSHP